MRLMSGAAWRYNAGLRTPLLADVLTSRNGMMREMTYRCRCLMGRFSLTPGIGALWNCAKQSRYY